MPVDGFWSLTMYEATPEGQFFLTANTIGRYAIGDRTPALRREENGALTLWIGRKNPRGDKTANWLPAPAIGPFMLLLRAYLPSPRCSTAATDSPRSHARADPGDASC